jgi:hypothetical protein
MATLDSLREKKHDLEARLDAGDLSVESDLSRIDAAIAARTRQIQHSQKRLHVVKQAVERGVSPQHAKQIKSKSVAAKRRDAKGNSPLNKFE